MKTAMVAAALGILAGACGGDGPTIDGGWSLPLGGTCGVVMTFDTGKKWYASQLFCQTTASGFGSEVESGDADFSVPGKVTMVPRETSCPTSDHSTDTAGYSFSGKRLILAGPQGSVFFDPIPDGPVDQSASIQYGCWDMGAFRAHPVQPL
jgi:hypothetical protein